MNSLPLSEVSSWADQARNVLCVDDKPNPNWHNLEAPNGKPVKGQIYRVAGSVRHATGTGLVLLGYPGIDKRYGEECGWSIDRFVPCGGKAE